MIWFYVSSDNYLRIILMICRRNVGIITLCIHLIIKYLELQEDGRLVKEVIICLKEVLNQEIHVLEVILNHL